MQTQDYIDEVRLRLKRHEVSQEMSDAEILTYVNRARNEVQKMTLGLYPERYSRVWTIGVGAQDIEPNYNQTDTYAAIANPSRYVQVAVLSLPGDFIEAEVIKMRYTFGARLEITEAREVTLKEFHQANMHSYNYPNITSPIYTVERRGNQYFLYISPSFSGTDLDIYNMDVEIWYTAAVMDLENQAGLGIEDTDTQIPIEFQTVVLKLTEVYILGRINPAVLPGIIVGELDRMKKMLQIHYQIDTDLQYMLLPSKEA